MSKVLGYVAIDLSTASRQILFDIVSETIPKKDYFRSCDPGYHYINGNVSKKGHLTICYGIKSTNLKQKFVEANLKHSWQHKASIKDIQINLGYQEQYYTVVVIPEINKDIFEFNDWIRQNNDIVIDSPPFDPHLALCYIKNPGNFPLDILNKLKRKLIGKNVEFESVNFYLPDEQEKINLISL